MLAGEKLKATDDYEVMLFPLEYMNISQDEYGGTSHPGTLNMDFLGWGANGRIMRCPYYAPCTCKLVSSTGDPPNNMIIWESVDKVHLADGTLDYVCWQVGHDNSPPYTLPGTVIQQGALMGRTGDYGPFVTGDHLHFNVARGHYAGFEQTASGYYQLKNSMHIYDGCYVNDTVIIQGYNHDWKTFDGGITPSPSDEPKKKRFPWVLYARKLRGN